MKNNFFLVILLFCVIFASCSNDKADVLPKTTPSTAGNTVDPCDTKDISFSKHIKPLLEKRCNSCHSGNFPASGYDFTKFDIVKQRANAIYGSVNYSSGFSPMPKGQGKMVQCEIDQIKAWIDAGTPNN